MQLLAVVLLFLVTQVTAFTNPILPGFNPDPTILRVGSDYFLATSTFEFFPGVPIYHSTDLISWTVISHALNCPSQLDLRGTAPSGGVFAPTLRYHEDTETFYLITTVFNMINPPDNITYSPRSLYVSTKDPWDDSAWSDPIYVDQAGFDPDLFFDSSTGKTYLTTTQGSGAFGYPNSGYFALWTTEIDLATGDSLTPSRFLHQSPLPDGTPKLTEGAHIFFYNGYYHLITADAGTDVQHRVMHYRSPVFPPTPQPPTPKVPEEDGWEANPHNPIIFNGANLSLPVLSTGHADFVSTPDGKWFTVFLGTRQQNPTNATGKNQLGRETFLAGARWDEDGWLIVNDGKPIEEQMPGLYELDRPTIWRDGFEGNFTDKEYYTQRTPYKAFHRFVEGGGLRLKGNIYTLSDRETPAAFFRKQVDLSAIWSSKLRFTPTSHLHKAGLTVFLSTWYHNEIGITIRPDTNATVLYTETRTGPLAALNTTYHNLPSEDGMTLGIEALPEGYKLGFSTEEGNQWLQAHVEGWQNFVGAHFGLFSTGTGLPMPGVDANFEYVQVERS
uniref:Beta-xylosidase C-terminal Concanavalin A-like domain-containing protein n=1 Tax=Moniliophthora roreri TaxID=221103 RepID=A0A0W0GE21_MONRR